MILKPTTAAGARLGPRAALATALAACALAPTPAMAALAPKGGDGALSPALTQLAKPSVRSQSRAEQAAALGVAADGPGSLLREGNRVLLNVRFEQGAIARLGALRDASAQVVSASRRYQTVTVAAAPAALREVAAVPGVASVTPARAPMLFECEGGAVISEGVAQLQAKAAREAFSVDGAGTTVGVLSDSYDQATEAADHSGPVATKAAQDEETADLPGPVVPGSGECAGQTTSVDVLGDFASSRATDEGRAMLQIVHDVAPGASLAFDTAFLGEVAFAQSIEDLAAPSPGGAEAEVIVDDVGYFEEPFFQDGPVAVAIDKVTADGVTYLSAAGNGNLFDGEGNEIASWEAPAYRDSGSCPSALRSDAKLNATHCMDFNPGAAVDRTFGIEVDPGKTLTVDLQWAEPWDGVGTDLDAFLLNANGELLNASVEDNPGETQRPVEIVQWPNGSSSKRVVQLVVNRYSGALPRLKFMLLQNGGGVSATEYPKSGGGDVVGPTVFGHAAAAGAIAAAAVPYDNSSAPEPYSSRGPFTKYFGPVEGTGPAPPLLPAEVVSKPDVAATDCGRTTFFARFFSGAWRFCGTSAAAPHAAGVVALMREAESLAEPADIRESVVDSAVPVGAFPSCAVGGGLLDALRALKAVKGEPIEPLEPPEACEPPDSSGEVFVAPGFWGSEDPTSPTEGETTPTPTPAPPPPAPPAAVAPNTFIKHHPPKLVRTLRASVRLVFRFGSDQAVSGFRCKVDRGRFRACGARFARRYAVGAHALRVKARGATGLLDSTPAVFRFRVKRPG